MFDSALDDGELERLLREDAPYGDLTTGALGIGALPGMISFAARAAMTVCGNAGNAAAYAATGVDILVTSAPYLAAPGDVKVALAA